MRAISARDCSTSGGGRKCLGGGPYHAAWKRRSVRPGDISPQFGFVLKGPIRQSRATQKPERVFERKQAAAMPDRDELCARCRHADAAQEGAQVPGAAPRQRGGSLMAGDDTPLALDDRPEIHRRGDVCPDRQGGEAGQQLAHLVRACFRQNTVPHVWMRESRIQPRAVKLNMPGTRAVRIDLDQSIGRPPTHRWVGGRGRGFPFGRGTGPGRLDGAGPTVRTMTSGLTPGADGTRSDG
jgi:hypothetical protein